MGRQPSGRSVHVTVGANGPSATTDRRHVERRRADRQRVEALDRTISSIAHDLNNILGFIHAQADLLDPAVRPALDGHDADAAIQSVRDAVRRAESLTAALVAVGRLRTLASEAIDVNDVVRAVAGMARAQFAGRIDVEVVTGTDRPATTMRRGDLERVLWNLVRNAAEAMTEPGTVVITARAARTSPPDGARPGAPATADPAAPAAGGPADAPTEWVEVEVRDDGPGMDEHTVRHAFDPFFTTRPDGNGLGLTGSHQIVTERGGSIEISSAPGEGATFRLRLPGTARASATAPALPDADAPSPPVITPRPSRDAGSAPRPPAPAPRYWRLRGRLGGRGRRVARRVVDGVGAPFAGSVVGSAATGRLAPRAVALTFDDGPDPDTTPSLLRLLASRGCTATFFVLGDATVRHADLVRQVAAEGHEVALHGPDHRRLTTLPAREVTAHIARGRQQLASVLGTEPRWFRPPFGSQDLRSYVAARRLGMVPVVWSAVAGDWDGLTAAATATRALDAVGPGGILLLHERPLDERGVPVGGGDPVATARMVIDGLVDRGLRPVSVGELIRQHGARRTVWFRP